MKSMNLAKLGLTALLAVGCGSRTTRVRGVHASRDLGAIDIYVNQTRVVPNATFNDASEFVTPPEGEVRFQVTPANAAAPVLLDVTQNFSSNFIYTLLAVGRATAQPSSLQAVTVVDNGAAPAQGNFKVRLVHGVGPGEVLAGNGILSSGNWDVFITPALEKTDDPPVFANVPFAGQAPASGNPAQEFAAGDYAIRITPAGDPETTLFFNEAFPYTAGQDLVLVGVPAELPVDERVAPVVELAPVEILVVENDGTTFILPNNFGNR